MKENKVEQKKYLSCDLIEHGIDFVSDNINFCSRLASSGAGFKNFLEHYNGEKINWDDFFKLKNKYREEMKEGKILSCCKDCIYLYEKEWNSENYISHITFNNWLDCNSSCIYCILNHYKTHNKNIKYYNVYPIVKDLISKKLVKTNGNITIAGGEPTVIKEFEKLLTLLIDYKIEDIRIYTNGIKYSKGIEKGIKKGIVSLVISVDSGSRELYKKIKRTDSYDEVWHNIKKYSKVQIKDHQIKTKFIILPGVNDHYEEIDSWIQKTLDTGLKYIAIDIELHWYLKNKDNLPDKLFKIFKYIIAKATENNLLIEYLDRATMLLNKMEAAKLEP